MNNSFESWFIALSLCYSAIVITITAFQWVLVEILTVFLIGPLILLIYLGLLLLIIISFIALPFRIRKDRKWASFPLLINISTLLIIIFVPFTSMWLNWQFNSNWQEYNEVVQLIEDGEIKPNENGAIRLPPKYRHLSKGGGWIEVEKKDGVTRVFFYTFVGVLDNFSGFMYSSDNSPPKRGDLGGDWKQIEQQRPNWFFCASS